MSRNDTIFSDNCRFNKDGPKHRSMQVMTWGSGVRLTTYIEDMTSSGEDKQISVFLTDQQTQALFEALAEQFGFETEYATPAPASRLERRVSRVEDTLRDMRDSIDALLADNPF